MKPKYFLSFSMEQTILCSKCNYIYDESLGDPDWGILPGTRFEDIPDDWKCPVCAMKKAGFKVIRRLPTTSERIKNFFYKKIMWK